MAKGKGYMGHFKGKRTVGRPTSSSKSTIVRGNHGKAIRNGATYEALRRKGMSKTRAAMISNGVLNRGVAKGRRHGK